MGSPRNAVLARLLLNKRIHEAEVIEGIERCDRVFEREVTPESVIREAISDLIADGSASRDAEGWLTYIPLEERHA